MDDFVPGLILGALTGACAACLLWLLIIYPRIDHSWRTQIAKRGCAEFYLDENNNRQWRWK